jgi:hypothetical protein
MHVIHPAPGQIDLEKLPGACFKISNGRVAGFKKSPPRLTGNTETFSSGLHYKKVVRRQANQKPETNAICKSLQLNDVTCYQKQNFLCHTYLRPSTKPQRQDAGKL